MDIDQLADKSSQIIKVVITAPVTLSYYIYKCYRIVWWGPLACFIFFLVGTIVNNSLLPRIIKESRKVEAKEGDYRNILHEIPGQTIEFTF
jgi:hypothetical protein